MSLFAAIPFVKGCRFVIPDGGKAAVPIAAPIAARRGVLRRAALVCAVAWLGLGMPGGPGARMALAAPGEPALPARNLLVEWRVNGMSQARKQQQGIRSGQLIIDSRGRIIGRTDIGVNHTDTHVRSSSAQQLQVINGGRARLFVGQTQPHLVWQWAWLDAHPQPKAAFTAQTAWIDMGQGLFVRPRWPGGHAPVLVEFEAQLRQPAGAGGVGNARVDPDGQARRLEVGSTLSVPIGEWTVVARSGGRTERAQSGVLSTSDLDALESEQLEIRITAP